MRSLKAVLQKYAAEPLTTGNANGFGAKTDPLTPTNSVFPSGGNFGVKTEPLVPTGGLTPQPSPVPAQQAPKPTTPAAPPAPAATAPTPPPNVPAAAAPQPAAPTPPPAQASTASQPVSAPTTEGPNTPITPQAPASQATAAPSPEAVMAQMQDTKIPQPQRQEFARTFVQDHVSKNPEMVQGLRDFEAGNTNTPAAQKYLAQLKQSEAQFMAARMEELKAADPQKAATPEGWGSMFQQAAGMWEQMPQESKWMMGLGLPIGLIGVMSSLFGEGGTGMGLVGMLGLGAAGLGGAAGGLFGQGAQNMVADGLYNVGSFFGAVPNEKVDLSAMMGEDALTKLTAGPSLAEKARAAWNPEAYAKQIAPKLQAAEQAKKLMMIPEALRPRFLQQMSQTPLTDEEAQIVARNIGQLSAGMDDENSEIYKTLRRGNEFVANPTAARNQQVKGMFSSLFGGEEKGSSVMNISSAIEKWAFNTMDAKELKDLKAEKAKGVPYRVEDARREQQLKMRQQHNAAKNPPPAMRTKKCVAVVMKAARCWSGYEPVPGAKAYSRGSCRPVNSKKTQKEMISGKKKEK